MNPTLLTPEQLLELATLMAKAQDLTHAVANEKLSAEKQALERQLATAHTALREMGQEVKSQDDQAGAWREVFDLCLRLGMNSDQDKCGLDMVLEYLAALKLQAETSFMPYGISEHRPIEVIRDSTTGAVIEMIPGRTTTDITLKRHDGKTQEFCNIDPELAEFLLAPPQMKAKAKAKASKARSTYEEDEDDL